MSKGKTKLTRPRGHISPSEMAELHDIPVETIYKNLSRNRFPHMKVGRRVWIRRSDAKAWQPNNHIGRPSTGGPVRNHRLQLQLGDDEERLVTDCIEAEHPGKRRATAARELLVEHCTEKLGR